MKISVIIPVINEVALIERSIQSAWHAGCDEVFVVDGGSADGTFELVQTLDCKSQKSEPGRGGQLKAGANMATGDVLLFLHADGALAKNAIQQIRDTVDPDGSDWGGFLQRIESDRLVYRWMEWGNAARVRWQGLVYGDQGMWVTRRAWDTVGGYPEIPIMEDFELSRRLTKIRRPRLLTGPVLVDPRRWQTIGVVRQTLRNWLITLQYRLGRSPLSLSRQYRRHDQT